MTKMEFRTGTQNPLTLYVTSAPYNQKTGGRELPGWMREGEWSVGWLPHEGLVALVVEAMNAFVCDACPWGCPSCSLNRATCECYEHDSPDINPLPGRPALSGAPAFGVMTEAVNTAGVIDRRRYADEIAIDIVNALGAQGWRLIHE